MPITENCLPVNNSIQQSTYIHETGKIFSFEGTIDVQVVIINNEPWFVAVDVCNVLGLSHITHTMKRLDDDEKMTVVLLHSLKHRRMYVVNESGLYALIFQSRKPIARKFRKWVTSEVLPAIRKTGGYESEKYKLKAELWQAKYDSLKNAFDAVRIGYETMKQSYEWVKEDRDELRNFQREVMKLACKY